MKPTVLGIFCGVVLGVSLPYLYWGFEIGILTCAHRHQSEMCEANYMRTAFAEGWAALGALGCLGSLLWARRSRRSP